MEHVFSQDVLLDGVKREGNFTLAFFAGSLAAFIATAFWMILSAVVGENVYWLALGTGGLIGLAIRLGGRGSSPLFGLLGAVLTLLTYLPAAVFIAVLSGTDDKFSFYTILGSMDLKSLMNTLMEQTTSLMYLIYVASVVVAYLISIRKQEMY